MDASQRCSGPAASTDKSTSRWDQGPPASLFPPTGPSGSAKVAAHSDQAAAGAAPAADGDAPKDPSYEEVKQQLEEAKRSKEAFSKMPGMESVVSQLAFKVLQMESALEDLKPKIPPSAQARKLLEKITKKQRRLAKLKAQCSAAFQQLKGVRAAYAEARQDLIVLRDQWTQVDVNLGDPPSEISYGPDGPQDTQMDSGSEGDTEGAASLKRPRPGKGFKSWITSHGSGKAPSVLSDNRSSCGHGASDYSRT